ncbi:hypothetical protein MMC12_008592, partial [Toensbergia leucococca]|nr:hypothetical protein [Toensbergia leucococca]
PLLGPPPRAHNHNPLRPLLLPNPLHIFPRPKHNPIPLRRPNRLPLPPPNQPRQHLDPGNNSHQSPPPPPSPRLPDLLSRLPLRLRLPRPHRLHHLHPRQILQTPPRNVPAPDPLPQILSALQIPRRRPRDRRSRSLHSAPPLQKALLLLLLLHLCVIGMGTLAPRHQPPLRRPDKQHPRPHLQHPQTLLGPSNDGRPKRPLHPPHNHLSPPLPIPLPPPPPLPVPHNNHHHPCSRTLGTPLRPLLLPRPPVRPLRRPRLRRLRRRRPTLHLLHAKPLLEPAAGHGDGNAQDADHGAECAVVRPSVERDAMGGGGFGVWRGWGRGVDSEEGEGGEGQGEREGERGL